MKKILRSNLTDCVLSKLFCLLSITTLHFSCSTFTVFSIKYQLTFSGSFWRRFAVSALMQPEYFIIRKVIVQSNRRRNQENWFYCIISLIRTQLLKFMSFRKAWTDQNLNIKHHLSSREADNIVYCLRSDLWCHRIVHRFNYINFLRRTTLFVLISQLALISKNMGFCTFANKFILKY